MADILVINDDPAMRSAVVKILSAAGHTVREASDGARGMAAFHRHRSDLVIVDIVMPEKEGIEVIRELKKEAPATPVVAISGTMNRSFYLHAAVVLGADVSLEKPFRAKELRQVISRLLRDPSQAKSTPSCI